MSEAACVTDQSSAQRLYEVAKNCFEDFRVSWFETPGVPRSQGVVIAERASEAIERIWEHEKHLTVQQLAEAESWLDLLLHVPEIEKSWFGIAEYRRAHKIRGQSDPKTDAR